jgi:phage terminase small subunit
MPLLENRRHELFAQGLFQGSSIVQAYADAGFVRNEQNASRLASSDKVKARVAELAARSVASVNLSKEWVIEQLIGVVQDARSQEKPDSAGANKALNLLGLELGMFVERKEVGKPGEFDGLTIADKRARILGIAQQLGLHRISATEQLGFEGDTIEAQAIPQTVD